MASSIDKDSLKLILHYRSKIHQRELWAEIVRKVYLPQTDEELYKCIVNRNIPRLVEKAKAESCWYDGNKVMSILRNKPNVMDGTCNNIPQWNRCDTLFPTAPGVDYSFLCKSVRTRRLWGEEHHEVIERRMKNAIYNWHSYFDSLYCV
jgi:hypothetical protein